MNHDNRDDQTGRGKDSGGASPTHHDREDALAPVITLHHHTDTSTTDTGSPVVVEGEVISSSAVVSPVRSRRELYRCDVTTAHRHTVAVATSTTTITTGKALVRHTWFVLAGAGVLWTRWRDTHGTTRYERQMRAAEAACDQDRLLEWEARDVAEKARRHGRVMDWINAPLAWLKAAGTAVLSVLGLLVGLGVVLALATKDITQVIAPIVAVIDAVAWTVAFVTIYGSLLGALAMTGAVVGLWALGKARTDAPAWVAPGGQRPVDDTVTPSKTVIALRDLGIPTLTRAIKRSEDAGGAMLSPIRIAGAGVEVDIRLPSGVATSDIQSRRRRLAENLDRHEHELFITVPAPRTVRLWVADPGALDEPIGPSPLVTDPDGVRADIYTGHAPWGRDLRGQTRSISLLQSHLLITGLSNQGKTAALRALALWAMFDPTTEFRIADLKGIGDWHMFGTLTSELVEGPADEHVIAATEMLEHVVDEMQRRLASLDRDRYPDGVTRDLARKPGSGFHPLFAIVDEAQQAYMCPVLDTDRNPYGGRTSRSRFFMAVRKLHNQGRAVNVHLWQGTQDPTDQNLPKLVREGAHIRGSLVVGTESQARMAVGDKAVDGGAAPHLLRQGIDKGTLVLNGVGMDLPAGESSIILRTHFISGDEATELVTRATAQRAKTGHTTAGPGTGTEPAPHRNLLDDLLTVMTGHTRMRTQEALAALTTLDRAHYQAWTFARLTDELPTTARPYKSDGVMVLSTHRIHDAHTHHHTEPTTEPITDSDGCEGPQKP